LVVHVKLQSAVFPLCHHLCLKSAIAEGVPGSQREETPGKT